MKELAAGLYWTSMMFMFKLFFQLIASKGGKSTTMIHHSWANADDTFSLDEDAVRTDGRGRKHKAVFVLFDLTFPHHALRPTMCTALHTPFPVTGNTAGSVAPTRAST